MQRTGWGVLLFLAGSVMAAPVRVSEDTMRIPVQTELGADPNPSFLVSSLQNTFYPYPMRNQIKPDRPLQDVRVLTLENEYLICRVLPDFGGRLYSCRDKRNDREM